MPRERPVVARRGTLVERMVDWMTLRALRIMLRVVRWLIALRGRV